MHYLGIIPRRVTHTCWYRFQDGLHQGPLTMPVMPPHPANRLASASSPYLLQHARNPVDWWEWGEEALAEARRLDRPILLSVGYSACHWCHVMAHESFEDPEIAQMMNRLFVRIKVDR